MKFLVTDECQRLARWLRLCGYDAAVSRTQPLSELYRKAYNEQRSVITRNRKVRGGALCRVIQLEGQQLDEQLGQLVRERVLAVEAAATFTRCDVCNVVLELIENALVKDRVPSYVFQTQAAFHTCPSCQRIYWMATHWQRASQFLHRVREEAGHA